jgi:choice-of-anchor A domain-containing protein/LPXTG-motif cell wall-anchored protein
MEVNMKKLNTRRSIFATVLLTTFIMFDCAIAQASTVYSINGFVKESSTSSNLGTASDFNVFLFDDMTSSNSDCEGKMAIGGNLNLSSYGIGSKIDISESKNPAPATLIVGGSITVSNGQVNGNTIVKSGISTKNYNFNNVHSMLSTNNEKSSQPITITNNDIDNYFKSAKTSLSDLSARMSRLVNTGSVKVDNNKLIFSGNDKINIFSFDLNNISGKKLSDILTFSFDIPSGSTIIINVKGNNSGFINANICSGKSTDQSILKKHIIWNFYDATSIFSKFSEIYGSLLAPNAVLTAESGNFNGTCIAKSVVHAYNNSMEFHNYTFDGNIPSITPPTTTSATATPTITPSTSSAIISTPSPSAGKSITTSPSVSPSNTITNSPSVSNSPVSTPTKDVSIPKTGEHSPFTYIILGLLVTTVGIGYIFLIKNKN